MVAIFLVPAAGFYYNKHSCTKSGEVMLVLDDNYSCSDDEAMLVPDNDYSCSAGETGSIEPGCCSEESQSHHETDRDKVSSGCLVSGEINLAVKECCSNEGSYLKTDEKYTSPSKTEIPNVEISSTIAFNSTRLFSAPDITVEVNAHSPPLILLSRKILLQQGVLLI